MVLARLQALATFGAVRQFAAMPTLFSTSPNVGRCPAQNEGSEWSPGRDEECQIVLAEQCHSIDQQVSLV